MRSAAEGWACAEAALVLVPEASPREEALGAAALAARGPWGEARGAWAEESNRGDSVRSSEPLPWPKSAHKATRLD